MSSFPLTITTDQGQKCEQTETGDKTIRFCMFVHVLLVECVKLCVEKQCVIQCVVVEVFQLRLASCHLF